MNESIKDFDASISVVWAGVGRSGTTLLYQVLNEISRNFCKHPLQLSTATNAHSGEHLKGNNKKIIAVRDFRDIVASRWRINLSIQNKHNEVNLRQMTKNELDEELFSSAMRKQMASMNEIKDKYKDDTLLILHYEKFFDNFDWFFQQLEEFLEITIDDKVGLAKKCSIDNNLKKIENLTNFNNHGDNHFHGDHISPDRGKSVWKKYIPEEFHNYITEELSDDLKKWGY